MGLRERIGSGAGVFVVFHGPYGHGALILGQEIGGGLLSGRKHLRLRLRRGINDHIAPQQLDQLPRHGGHYSLPVPGSGQQLIGIEEHLGTVGGLCRLAGMAFELRRQVAR